MYSLFKLNSITNPELVVLSSRTFLNESSIIGGDVSVVGITLQHVDLQFDLLFFFLNKTTDTEIKPHVF